MDRFDQNGIIEGYNIFYRTSRNLTTATNDDMLFYNETFEKKLYTPSSKDGDTFRFDITGLEGGKDYDVVVQAFTSKGVGPGSEIEIEKAEKG